MKKRGKLIAIVSAVAIAGVGITFAVSRDQSVLNNNFDIATYSTTATESFASPSGWRTCQTVPKIITVTNNSNMDVAVRIKLDEEWVASDGTTKLPLVSAASGLTMAQIEFTPDSGWTKKGAYYVYDTNLAANATTSSLITGVTLNCDANLDTSATAAVTSDGAYADATYHLKATIQTIQADAKNSWYDPQVIIAEQVNEPYNIDFSRRAIVSSDPATANGNGVNKYTENGTDIYYFRGQIDNNNVIWANICWKIVRTTATGGVKMIYNGEPTTVGDTKQCNATSAATRINNGTYSFNYDSSSPADVGYKYGTRITYRTLSAGSTQFTFSNSITKDGDTYTLDTSAGQSISGTWANKRTEAATRYHYFCTDGATSCDNTKIGYIHCFGNNGTIYYLPVGGYTGIEAMKAAMFANTNDSVAKSTIESWFVNKNLDGHVSGSRNYEDDLEDAIFCNDRSYFAGSIKGEDSDATPSIDSHLFNYHGAAGRDYYKTGQNIVVPSLDCANHNDAFQVSNNDAKLNHKIGLITADELTLAGSGWHGYDSTAYLNNGAEMWAASPGDFGDDGASVFVWGTGQTLRLPWGHRGLRPMVSLKSGMQFASGTGLRTDPYIVE